MCKRRKERRESISDTLKKRRNGFYVRSERYISEENNKNRPKDPGIYITRKEQNRHTGERVSSWAPDEKAIRMKEHIPLSGNEPFGGGETSLGTWMTNVFFTHFTSIHPSLCPHPASQFKCYSPPLARSRNYCNR